MLKRILRKSRYAFLLFRIGGPAPFIQQVRRQIYSRATFLGLEKDLGTGSAHVPCSVDYSLRLASKDDMEEMLLRSRSEGRASAHELTQRGWFYECGFNDCYVARLDATGELCYVQWLVSSADDGVIGNGFGSRLPKLEDGEILVENSYTFREHRGRGIMASAMVELAEIARRRGFKRMLAYVGEDNVASLRGVEKAGFRVFGRMSESKFLFLTRRHHT